MVLVGRYELKANVDNSFNKKILKIISFSNFSKKWIFISLYIQPSVMFLISKYEKTPLKMYECKNPKGHKMIHGEMLEFAK